MKLTLLAMMAISSLSFAQSTPEQCQVAYNGLVSGVMIGKTQGGGFYDLASQYAKRNGTCVKADMAGSNQGVRIYNADGSRASGKNGSQYSKSSQSAYYRCVTMTCIAVVDSKAQTDAGYGTGRMVQPGSVMVNPSYPTPAPSSSSY